VHQLVIKKGFSIVDARCNHEVYWHRLLAVMFIVRNDNVTVLSISYMQLTLGSNTQFASLNVKR